MTDDKEAFEVVEAAVSAVSLWLNCPNPWDLGMWPCLETGPLMRWLRRNEVLQVGPNPMTIVHYKTLYSLWWIILYNYKRGGLDPTHVSAHTHTCIWAHKHTHVYTWQPCACMYACTHTHTCYRLSSHETEMQPPLMKCLWNPAVHEKNH